MQKHLFASATVAISKIFHNIKCYIKISLNNATVHWYMLVLKHRSNFWNYITSEVARNTILTYMCVWTFLNISIRTLATYKNTWKRQSDFDTKIQCLPLFSTCKKHIARCNSSMWPGYYAKICSTSCATEKIYSIITEEGSSWSCISQNFLKQREILLHFSCDTNTHTGYDMWTIAETAVDEMVRWCSQWKVACKKKIG